MAPVHWVGIEYQSKFRAPITFAHSILAPAPDLSRVHAIDFKADPDLNLGPDVCSRFCFPHRAALFRDPQPNACQSWGAGGAPPTPPPPNFRHLEAVNLMKFTVHLRARGDMAHVHTLSLAVNAGCWHRSQPRRAALRQRTNERAHPKSSSKAREERKEGFLSVGVRRNSVGDHQISNIQRRFPDVHNPSGLLNPMSVLIGGHLRPPSPMRRQSSVATVRRARSD
ncbi:hypothetical protein EVAR_38247_1 [Eumeta japonica]|uniref:Uncharacterized protein n=1 Tax=Eumeta variegata TaxID=151549 RepID=A0A4C1YAG0_EUMVA|nr:hypothetical protein EVAR_38247_1 [Eumeta japonica]